MNNRLLSAILAIVILVAGIIYFRFGYFTEEAKYKRQVNQFIKCLPDPIDAGQIDEVKMILDRFRHAVKRGETTEGDIEEVVTTLSRHIDKESISVPELKVFMARVSYLSFRNRPEHKSDEGEVRPPDHPLLMDSTSTIE